MSIKSYKFRFYPTPEQEQMLAQTFGCIRYVYNRALEHRTKTYKTTGKGATYCDTSKELTSWKKDAETAWLKDVSSVPLQQCLRHLNSAFTNFFAKRSKYPSFKKKSRNQSAEFTKSGFKWDTKNRNLTIAKLGRLNVKWSRLFISDPTTVTISRTPTGKYFVSIRINEPNKDIPTTTKQIGIDLGIKTLAFTSDGQQIENIKTTNKYAKKLARAQRVMSRRKKGSNRRERARLRVAKIHEKIANVRKDWIHKVTTKLIQENQLISMETLSSSKMMKNRKLAKSIADCSWYEFVRQIAYKSEWYGRTFIQISQWEPSSKKCSCCGFKVDKMPLSIRDWICPECDTGHDRDENAAKNILAAGLAES